MSVLVWTMRTEIKWSVSEYYSVFDVLKLDRVEGRPERCPTTITENTLSKYSIYNGVYRAFTYCGYVSQYVYICLHIYEKSRCEKFPSTWMLKNTIHANVIDRIFLHPDGWKYFRVKYCRGCWILHEVVQKLIRQYSNGNLYLEKQCRMIIRVGDSTGKLNETWDLAFLDPLHIN